jgi:plasmid stabilization system protein ParE
MVRKIEWTLEGRKSKLEILQYWVKRNQSNSYPKKLNKLIGDALKTILKLPELGRPTEEPFIKYIMVQEYDVFYKELPESIHVLLVWDSRRDPSTLKYRK